MSTETLVKYITIFLMIHDGTGQLENTLQKLDDIISLFPDLGTENPDALLNFTQLAAKYGHPAEEHIIYTEDGYRLKVFHLQGKKEALPILLFHGFGDSSDSWIIRGNESMAITLANAGYDVWLGNVRGNKYSQGPLSLSIDLNSTYWNFSFHEHGIYDLPATIDLVLTETGASKLNAIGHSQGNTIYYVLLSTKPEYNEKVNMLIAFAPIAYLNHLPPPLGTLLRAAPAIYKARHKVHKYEVFGDTSQEHAIGQVLCTRNAAMAYLVCLEGLTFPLTGYDATEISVDFSLVIFDYFSTQEDVALLRKKLPNVVKFVINPYSKMNHADYVWGEHMSTYLYPYVFDSLSRFG